jgi:hypothetical protein
MFQIGFMKLLIQEVKAMKHLSLAVGVFLIVLFAGVVSAGARDYHGYGWRGGVIVAPVWTPWPYSYSYPYYYPYSYGYREPAMVIERDPPVYYQQHNEPEEQYYWYYCRNPKGYYPYVQRCPEGWKKVLPTPSPSDGKE